MKYIKDYKIYENKKTDKFYRYLSDDEWDRLSEGSRNLCNFNDSEIHKISEFAKINNLEFYIEDYDIKYLVNSSNARQYTLNGNPLEDTIIEKYTIELYGPNGLPREQDKKYIHIYKEDDEYYDVLIDMCGKQKSSIDFSGQWRCDQIDGLMIFLNDFWRG